MRSSLSSLRGESAITICRFQQYAVNQKISHKDYRESLGIIGIESLSFMCDRMFHIMDRDHDGFVSALPTLMTLDLPRRVLELH